MQRHKSRSTKMMFTKKLMQLCFVVACFGIIPIITIYHNRVTYINTLKVASTEPLVTNSNNSQQYTEGTDPEMCNVTCMTGIPCEYHNEEGFRIIVLTYNRPRSLAKCLEKLHHLELLNATMTVNIWIDRSKSGQVNKRTLAVSRQFAVRFTKGRVCIHVQERNAYIIGQWIDTWRPKPNTTEIGLILEDDVDVSPFVYIWLLAVSQKYGNASDVSGYTIKSENLWFLPAPVRNIGPPKSEVVFAYRMMGTWGYAPQPQKWREFQDWYHDVRPKGLVKPYVPNVKQTRWYRKFEKRNYQDSMWEMWHHYHDYINQYFTIYNNLMNFVKTDKRLLSTNRREKGLHFSRSDVKNRGKFLLSEWSSKFVDLPDENNITKYDYDGRIYDAESEQHRTERQTTNATTI